MKKTVLLLSIAVLTACSALKPDKVKAPETKPTIKLTLVPQDALAQGKTTKIIAKLNNIEERAVVTDDDLDTVHTQKFHLLVVDPTLTDYQHLHPQPTSTRGVYSFAFTPKLAGGYRAWADITPKATHKQEFAMTDIGAPRGGGITKTETREANVGGYHFTLSFDKLPVAESESMGSIRITDKKGRPVEILQPVMGANAHIVGFYDDFRTVMHTHPMDGHGVMFHLAPAKAGFVKLFAQVKIDGKEFFAPFGVMISAPKP